MIKGEVILAWELLMFYTESFGIEDVLTCRQRAKWYALDNLWQELYPNEEYLSSEEHDAFSIISHNSFGFNVSWLCKDGMRIETPQNSYLVVFDK